MQTTINQSSVKSFDLSLASGTSYKNSSSLEKSSFNFPSDLNSFDKLVESHRESAKAPSYASLSSISESSGKNVSFSEKTSVQNNQNSENIQTTKASEPERISEKETKSGEKSESKVSEAKEKPSDEEKSEKIAKHTDEKDEKLSPEKRFLDFEKLTSSEERSLSSANGKEGIKKIDEKNKSQKKLSSLDEKKSSEKKEVLQDEEKLSVLIALKGNENLSKLQGAGEKEEKLSLDSEKLAGIEDVSSDSLEVTALMQENLLTSELNEDFTDAKTKYLDKDGKIRVTDLRTEEKVEEKSDNFKFSEAHFDGKNGAEIDVNLSESQVSSNVLSNNTQSSSSVSSNFQAMLSNQISENAPEIVKAGNIILKNNDVGEIKLILHPEELGNVKISLHIEDKTISGKIIVQSEAAFNALKESAEALKEAFQSSGYESSSFDLSFAGGNQNNSSGEGELNGEKERFVQYAYEGVTGDDEDFESGYYEEFSENSLHNSVNIVA